MNEKKDGALAVCGGEVMTYGDKIRTFDNKQLAQLLATTWARAVQNNECTHVYEEKAFRALEQNAGSCEWDCERYMFVEKLEEAEHER